MKEEQLKDPEVRSRLLRKAVEKHQRQQAERNQDRPDLAEQGWEDNDARLGRTLTPAEIEFLKETGM